MSENKDKLKVEKIGVSAEVEWTAAKAGLDELHARLAAEITYLETTDAIRDAYSPITWVKMCRYLKHATEGMAAVRLSVEGKTAQEIHTITGIPTSRIGAFKAWNTIWKKSIAKMITIKWRKEQERLADIAFLRSIGISTGELEATHE